MKIYMIYASIPESIFNDISEFLPNLSVWSYDDETNRYIGLYGWTRNKDLYKDFIDVRKDCEFYRYLSKDLDKHEYDEFKKEFLMMKLKYYKYSRGDYNDCKSVAFPSTKWEYECTDSSAIENNVLYRIYGIFGEMGDYYIFKDDVIEALDVIGYTTLYDSVYGGDDCFCDEEKDARVELALYNMSYGLTVRGNKFIDIFSDKFGIFMTVFNTLIFGTKQKNRM